MTVEIIELHGEQGRTMYVLLASVEKNLEAFRKYARRRGTFPLIRGEPTIYTARFDGMEANYIEFPTFGIISMEASKKVILENESRNIRREFAEIDNKSLEEWYKL